MRPKKGFAETSEDRTKYDRSSIRAPRFDRRRDAAPRRLPRMRTAGSSRGAKAITANAAQEGIRRDERGSYEVRPQLNPGAPIVPAAKRHPARCAPDENRRFEPRRQKRSPRMRPCEEFAEAKSYSTTTFNTSAERGSRGTPRSPTLCCLERWQNGIALASKASARKGLGVRIPRAPYSPLRSLTWGAFL